MQNVKGLIFIYLLVLPVICMGNTNNHIPLDTVEITTFRDTVYDSNLPAIEFKLQTYYNFYGSTTAGYNLILRGAEIDLNGAILYKGDPELGQGGELHLINPFHIHVGDSTDNRRIDCVFVKHKFPFNDRFHEDDSLVVLTDKGNFTLYFSEEKRSAAKYAPKIETLSKELTDTEQKLSKSLLIIAAIIVICIIGGLICLIYYRREQRKKSEEMNKLLALLSENEMSNRQLKAKMSDLMRNNFNTINRLCYEYFEKSDTNFLKRSIYAKVEQEIDKLKSQEQLADLEKFLDEYCEGLITRLTSQLPQLSDADKQLLVYLYSGLSARTICILMDIQLKTFYMRRLRLKNKIAESDAPDKEWFIANM